MKNVLILSALLILGACSGHPIKPKETIALIAGLHVDGNIWTEVKQQLNQESFVVMDLGRLGRDTELASSLESLATQSCQNLLTPSTIIAHSFGGAIVNQMTGTCPEKIKRIIYLGALVPLKGEKPLDLLNRTDQRNYSKAVTFGRSKIIPKEAPLFFKATGSELKGGMAPPQLYSEWIGLISRPVNYNEDLFQKIPKTYLFIKDDPLLNLTTQFRYTSRTNITDVRGIEGGHYPMLTNSQKVVQEIQKTF